MHAVGKGHPKAWAHRLKEREEAGEILPSASRAMWRNAIGVSSPKDPEPVELPPAIPLQEQL